MRAGKTFDISGLATLPSTCTSVGKELTIVFGGRSRCSSITLVTEGVCNVVAGRSALSSGLLSTRTKRAEDTVESMAGAFAATAFPFALFIAVGSMDNAVILAFAELAESGSLPPGTAKGGLEIEGGLGSPLGCTDEDGLMIVAPDVCGPVRVTGF